MTRFIESWFMVIPFAALKGARHKKVSYSVHVISETENELHLAWQYSQYSKIFFNATLLSRLALS